MKKLTAIAVLLALILFAGCGQKYSKPEPTYDNESEKDDYAVYSLSIEYVYLRNLLSHNKEPIETIVIIAETNELGEYWESIGGSWGGRFNDGNHYSLEHNGVK